jgi:hypothetical protein
MGVSILDAERAIFCKMKDVHFIGNLQNNKAVSGVNTAPVVSYLECTLQFVQQSGAELPITLQRHLALVGRWKDRIQ